MADYNFQAELEKSILHCDEKLNKKELLIDIFKSYVAKLFELCLKKSKTPDRIEFDSLVQIKKNLINEFRAASLAEYQLSTERYEHLFETTVKEIMDFSASLHQGIDITSLQPQVLDINKPMFMDMKKNESGLFIP